MRRPPSEAVHYAASILKYEAQAIQSLVPKLGASFDKALELCQSAQRVILAGIGKSGIVGQKISATFASVGIPSWFLHAAEVGHGDLGRLSAGDVCILISNSGETEEVLNFAALLKRDKVKFIAITAKPTSSLAKVADVVLATGELEEADVAKLVPTASTTAVMALGDALALAAAGKKLTPEGFWAKHPGGHLGLRFSKVDSVMRKGKDCPILADTISMIDAILAICTSAAGAVIIIQPDLTISGVFTDGDLRRAIRGQKDVNISIKEVMTKDPKSIESGSQVDAAMVLFSAHSIGDLPVVDKNRRPIGMISLKDLAKAAFA